VRRGRLEVGFRCLASRSCFQYCRMYSAMRCKHCNWTECILQIRSRLKVSRERVLLRVQQNAFYPFAAPATIITQYRIAVFSGKLRFGRRHSMQLPACNDSGPCVKTGRRNGRVGWLRVCCKRIHAAVAANCMRKSLQAYNCCKITCRNVHIYMNVHICIYACVHIYI